MIELLEFQRLYIFNKYNIINKIKIDNTDNPFPQTQEFGKQRKTIQTKKSIIIIRNIIFTSNLTNGIEICICL